MTRKFTVCYIENLDFNIKKLRKIIEDISKNANLN